MIGWFKRRAARKAEREAKAAAFAAGEEWSRQQIAFVDNAVDEWLEWRLVPLGPRMLDVFKQLSAEAVGEEDPIEAVVIQYHILVEKLNEVCTLILTDEFERDIPNVSAALTEMDQVAGPYMGGRTYRAAKMKQVSDVLDEWRLDRLLEGLEFGKELVASLGEDAPEKFRAQTVGLLVDLMTTVTFRQIEAGRPNMMTDKTWRDMD